MSNVFKEQTQEEFDAEMREALAQIKRGEARPLEETLDEIEKAPDDEKIHELFPVEELEEAFAQIERGEVYTIEEVEAELEEKFAKEYGGEFSYDNDRISENKSA